MLESGDAASIGVGLSPAGVFADIYTAGTGEDYFTGEDVSGWMRAAVVVPGVGELRKAGRVADAARGSAAAAEGVSVLGHYPGYVNAAQSIGARYFNVPSQVGARMSPAQQWAANTRFLDRLVARGDSVLLSTPASQARAGSWFARELEYLSSRGYSLSADGTRMLPKVR